MAFSSSPVLAREIGMKWFILLISFLDTTTAMATVATSKVASNPQPQTSKPSNNNSKQPKKVKIVANQRTNKNHKTNTKKSSSKMYPVPSSWPTSETCSPDESLNKSIEASTEAKLVKKACANEATESPECLVPMFKLASKAFDIDYPLVQCMFGRETVDASGAAEMVDHLFPQQTEEKENSVSVNFKASANEGTGRGLGQLTTPAIRAVQELIDPNLSPEEEKNRRFDCKLYQRNIAFFKAVGQKLPSILITRDKPSALNTSAFSEFTPSHNIAVSISYLYDIQKNRLSPKEKKKGKSESLKKYRDRIVEITARAYNSAEHAVSYGQGVLACSKEVRSKMSELAGSPLALIDSDPILPDQSQSR